jgi:hypothetical protein
MYQDALRRLLAVRIFAYVHENPSQNSKRARPARTRPPA